MSDLTFQIYRANAALGSFARIEEELRSIQNGLIDDPARERLGTMIQTNLEIAQITKQRREAMEVELETLRTKLP